MKADVLMSPAEIEAFLDEVFPQMQGGKRRFSVEEVAPQRARIRLFYNDKMLRPGGTISGPAMMSLADIAAYVVILAHVGRKALAVTTNLNISFLRRPEQKDLIAEAELIKLGQRLAVTDIRIRSDGAEALVAHATCTYSIPPE